MSKPGAFAVIFDEQGRVLLCHRRDIDLWNLPGGGVEEGESPWDEADDVRWFPLDTIPPNTSPKQVARIHHAAQNLVQPVLQEQTGPTSREIFGPSRAT